MANLFALFRRHIGVFAAFVYSGANFCLAFVLQSSVESAAFGLYAFAMVLVQFGMGLSNALFASPLLVRLADREVGRGAVVQSFALANVLFIATGSLALCGVMLAVGMAAGLVGLVVLQAAALWLRWFLRAVELASNNFLWPAGADIAYGVATLLAGAIFFMSFGIGVFPTLLAMLSGTLVSMVVIGRGTFPLLFVRGRLSLAPFRSSFHQHGFWASVGVVTTEITANLHTYVLTLCLGPAAFAPVATLALFFRPIPILTQAVTQFERPGLARKFRDGAFDELAAGVRMISTIMTGGVMLNFVLIAAILFFESGLIGGGRYDTQTLWPLLALLTLGQIVRGLRTGPSAALQAAGKFRPLAFTTIYSSIMTIGGTIVAIAIGWQTILVVLGAVVAGECACLILTKRIYSRTLTAEAIR